MRSRRIQPFAALLTAVVAASLCPRAHAAERVTLSNGFELDCTRQEVSGDRVRLYLLPAPGPQAQAVPESYIEVAANAVSRSTPIPDAVSLVAAVAAPVTTTPSAPIGLPATPSAPVEVHQLIAQAGVRHNIDADLLAAVVHAESNGNARAVSHAGARGLMQLMPSTASALGVRDTFAADQNIGAGTGYLDQMLVRYHDNLELALAAYNAGPAAVDRYHGIPPYRETRSYVARVIREFNRRKLEAAK